MTVSMFEQPTAGIVDNCNHCRWNGSKMCPRSYLFVGRPLRDEFRVSAKNEICHRFTLTTQERDRRWTQVMRKLEENLY